MPPITTTANGPNKSKAREAMNSLQNDEPDTATTTTDPMITPPMNVFVTNLKRNYSKNGSVVSINGNAPSELLDRTLTPPSPRAVPDGGFGWVIVFCSSCITSIVGASYVAFAICYVELVEAFGTSKAVTGWVGSIYMATGSLLGIFFSVGVHEYGSRPVCIVGSIVACLGYVLSSFATSVLFLYISFGLVAGSGVGMVVLSTLVITQHYFDKHRALASGIAVSGFSLGTLVAGPLMRALMDAYSWRGAFLIFGAIFLQVAVFALFFRPLPIVAKQPMPMKTIPDGEKSIAKNEDVKLITDASTNDSQGLVVNGTTHKRTASVRTVNNRCANLTKHLREAFDFSLLRDVPLCLYVASQFLGHFGITTFYQHTPSRASYLGVERHLVALLPTITGAATGVSRIAFSFVANAPCTDRILQYAIALSIGGVIQSMTFLATDFVVLAVYGIMQGIVNGGFFCIMTTILVDLKGIENIARAQSISAMSIGLSLLVATPFSGFLFDITRNYDLPFFVSGVMQVVGGLLALLCVCLRRHRRNQKALQLKDVPA